MTLSNVDLPTPDAPTIATYWPAATESDRSEKIRRGTGSPKDLATA
jgi:hypothetical protein